MNSACCSLEILLLLQSATGSSICTTDVMTEDPGGNRGPSVSPRVVLTVQKVVLYGGGLQGRRRSAG